MNKFKDIIYDKSDILVALIIISIAGLVIFSKINAILSYPEIFAATLKPMEISKSAISWDIGSTSPSAAVNGANSAIDEIEMLGIYVNYGESLQTIAEKFVSVGLFSTTEEFLAAIEEANVQTQIKTGNFIIPSNATPEEVIEIIIKPGL
jgi:hypothetical protein